MNNKIKKPMMIAKEEFRANLANLINSSGIPIYIIEPILDSVLNEVRSVMQMQYQRELQEYNQSLIEAKEQLDEEVDE